MDTVGIVGLGVMGSNCAKKLMESGVPVAGYDPYPPAVKRASEAGVSMCGSPAELAGKAGGILMFVPGPADTEKVVLGEGGIASGAPEGTVVVNMSTVDPGVNIRMGEALAPKGIDFVDAPVMGSPSGVGSWAFALGGSDEALAKIKDVLLVLSGSEEKLFHIGPLGHGNKLKLLNNMMLGAIDACAAETMALAEHMGLSQKTLIDVAVAANARVLSNAYKEIGTRIAEGRYDGPTFTVDMLIKDNKLCLDMAREYGAPDGFGSGLRREGPRRVMEGRGEKLEGIVPAVGSAGWVRRETGFIRVFRVNGAFQAAVPGRIESSGFRMVLPQKHMSFA